MTIPEFQERLDKARTDNERVSLSIQQLNLTLFDDLEPSFSWEHVISMNVSPYSIHFRIVRDRAYLYIEHGFTDEVFESKQYTLESGARRYFFMNW